MKKNSSIECVLKPRGEIIHYENSSMGARASRSYVTLLWGGAASMIEKLTDQAVKFTTIGWIPLSAVAGLKMIDGRKILVPLNKITDDDWVVVAEWWARDKPKAVEWGQSYLPPGFDPITT